MYIWKLTLHWYPKAAEAGKSPVANPTFHDSEQDWEKHPEWYVPKAFLFQNPPTREDFTNLYNKTPWMQTVHCACREVMENVVNNPLMPWPIMESYGKKGSVAHIYKDDKKIGHIEVWREEMTENPAYVCPFLLSKDVEKAIKMVCKDKKVDAFDLSNDGNGFEQLLKERMMREPAHEKQHDLTLHQALKQLLDELGYNVLVLTKQT